MRRKPYAINGTISERTLLTGNNWVSGQAATIGYNITADALSNSITNVLDNSWLNVDGRLNANSGSLFRFGTSGRLNMYGSLNAVGTTFTSANAGVPWTGITIATGVALNTFSSSIIK
ncbi:MAG: hypothetical protein C4326_00970 [Ignavibacteria bacterium]